MLKKMMLASSVLAVSFNAFADGFDGKVMSQEKFIDVVQATAPDQIASHFGKPDSIAVMKDFNGKQTGMIWVYRDSVLKSHGMLDAQFVLVDGKMKYVSLNNPI